MIFPYRQHRSKVCDCASRGRPSIPLLYQLSFSIFCMSTMQNIQKRNCSSAFVYGFLYEHERKVFFLIIFLETSSSDYENTFSVQIRFLY